jgi:hypothetical protein
MWLRKSVFLLVGLGERSEGDEAGFSIFGHQKPKS